MGGADNICSDKTGTLTKNLMTVTKVFVESHIHESLDKEIMSDKTCRLLCLGVCNNSNANPVITAKSNEQIGNKTECALLEMAFKMGYDYKKFRSRDKIKKIFPFSSAEKKMATIYEDEKGKLLCFVKGAPDFLLSHCTSYINADGNVSKIDASFTNRVQEVIEEMAAGSLRTLLLVYKEVRSVPEEWDEIKTDLTIITMVGIKDPLRDGIPEAVRACHEGGVRVRMVTGDNKSTAIAIAKEAGILDPNWVETEGDCTVMEGKDFREFVGGLVNEGTDDETVGDL